MFIYLYAHVHLLLLPKERGRLPNHPPAFSTAISIRPAASARHQSVDELKAGVGGALLRDGGWKPFPVANQRLHHSTIFGQDYLTVSIDEAYMLRNRSHHIFSLTARAAILVLTATPIFTNVRELVSLSFTRRVPALCSKEGVDLWKEAEAPWCSARQNAQFHRRSKHAIPRLLI